MMHDFGAFFFGVCCICILFAGVEVVSRYVACAFWFTMRQLANIQFIRKAVNRGFQA